MHHLHLREIAKFASGLMFADLIGTIWFSAVGLFPVSFLGLTFESSAVLPIILFDLLSLALLVHYGWHVKLPVESPKERTLLLILGLVLAIVSVIHLTRLAFGWNVEIAGFIVPEWLSWIGSIVTAYLSYSSFHFALHKK